MRKSKKPSKTQPGTLDPDFGIGGVQALEKARQHPHFQWVEGSWVLEDNTPVNDLLEDFSGQLTKRYRIYRREIQS